MPLAKSCSRYWKCHGGYPRLEMCPALLVFDKKSRRCVIPPTEDCQNADEQKRIPAELEEEEEDDDQEK